MKFRGIPYAFFICFWVVLVQPSFANLKGKVEDPAQTQAAVRQSFSLIRLIKSKLGSSTAQPCDPKAGNPPAVCLFKEFCNEQSHFQDQAKELVIAARSSMAFDCYPVKNLLGLEIAAYLEKPNLNIDTKRLHSFMEKVKGDSTGRLEELQRQYPNKEEYQHALEAEIREGHVFPKFKSTEEASQLREFLQHFEKTEDLEILSLPFRRINLSGKIGTARSTLNTYADFISEEFHPDAQKLLPNFYDEANPRHQKLRAWISLMAKLSMLDGFIADVPKNCEIWHDDKGESASIFFLGLKQISEELSEDFRKVSNLFPKCAKISNNTKKVDEIVRKVDRVGRSCGGE